MSEKFRSNGGIITKRKKKKKESLSRIVSVILCVVVFAYMAYNAFAYSYSPVSTVALTEKQDFEETFEFKGFVVRDEKEIDNSKGGTVIPLVRDGKRVAKGDSIAVICRNDEEAAAYKRLENAAEELQRYQNLNNSDGMQDLSAEKLNSEISEAYGQVMDSVTSGDFDSLGEALEQFNAKSATKQILADGSIDVSQQMTELDKEIKALSAKKLSYSAVNAPDSGYYINTVDGYENTVKYDEVTSLTSKDIKEALKAKPSEKKQDSLGKLVGSYRWYIVGTLGKEHSTDFVAEGKVKVNFPDSGIKGVNMDVVSIRKEGDSLVAVLSCDLMNETYANMRTETVQVVTKSGTGFRIPANAIRFDKENKSGIYVLRGKIITFVYAEILYSDGKNAIVDSADSNGGGIALYDEVITKGKDIKDGKVIR